MPRALVTREKAASDRKIRALLGQRFRQHCDSLQQIPLSERLIEIVEQLIQRLEERVSEPSSTRFTEHYDTERSLILIHRLTKPRRYDQPFQ